MRAPVTLILTGIVAAVIAMVASRDFESRPRPVPVPAPAPAPVPASPAAGSLTAPVTVGPDESASPQTVQALKNAKRAMREERWSQALQALQPAIAARDKTPYLATKTDEFLGYLLYKSNRYEEAISAFERVVRSDELAAPEVERYKKHLAQLEYKTGDFHAAISWAEDALRASPRDEDLLVIAAQAAFQTEDFQAAMERATDLLNFQEASGRVPDENHIHLLAGSLEKMGNSTGSFEALQKWCFRLEQPRENGICIQMGIQKAPRAEAGRRGSIPVDE